MPKTSKTPGIAAYTYQTKDGKTVVQYMFRLWHRGEQYYKSGFENKTQAVAAREAILTDLRRQETDFTQLRHTRTTFPEMVEDLARRNLIGKCDQGYFFLDPKSDLERKKDMGKIRRLAKYFETSKAQMLPMAILNFVNARRQDKSLFAGNDDKVVDRTVRLDVNALRKLYDLAVVAKLVAKHPFQYLDKSQIRWAKNQPKKRITARTYLEPEVVRKIVAESVRYMLHFNENAFFIVLMAYTGNRPKQITTLRLEDFRQNAVGVRPAAEKSAMHRTGAGRVIILDARLHKYFLDFCISPENQH